MLVRPSDIGCHLRQCLANTEHFYNFGPTSKTFGGRCTNFMQMFCVCWALSIILGDIFFRISKLEVGTNCYERKQDIQQWPPSPKNKNKCSMVNKLHPVVLQSRPISYTSGAKNIIHEL